MCEGLLLQCCVALRFRILSTFLFFLPSANRNTTGTQTCSYTPVYTITPPPPALYFFPGTSLSRALFLRVAFGSVNGTAPAAAVDLVLDLWVNGERATFSSNATLAIQNVGLNALQGRTFIAADEYLSPAGEGAGTAGAGAGGAGTQQKPFVSARVPIRSRVYGNTGAIFGGFPHLVSWRWTTPGVLSCVLMYVKCVCMGEVAETESEERHQKKKENGNGSSERRYAVHTPPTLSIYLK